MWYCLLIFEIILNLFCNMTKLKTKKWLIGNKHAQTHGFCGTKEYKTWDSMRQRCENPKSGNYKYYGGRGIKVCKQWSKVENFIKDMGLCPKGMSLDRIDNNKGYSKSNSRWATAKEQANNTRYNVLITHKERTLSVSQWAKKLGIHQSVISWRFHRGWSIEKILSIKK